MLLQIFYSLGICRHYQFLKSCLSSVCIAESTINWLIVTVLSINAFLTALQCTLAYSTTSFQMPCNEVYYPHEVTDNIQEEVDDPLFKIRESDNITLKEVSKMSMELESRKFVRVAGYLRTSKASLPWRVLRFCFVHHPLALAFWILAPILLLLGFNWEFSHKKPQPLAATCNFLNDSVSANITVHFRTRYFGTCGYGPIHNWAGIIDSINGNKEKHSSIYGRCGNTTILITKDTSVPADFSI